MLIDIGTKFADYVLYVNVEQILHQFYYLTFGITKFTDCVRLTKASTSQIRFTSDFITVCLGSDFLVNYLLHRIYLPQFWGKEIAELIFFEIYSHQV